MSANKAKTYAIEMQVKGEAASETSTAAYTDSNFTLQINVMPERQKTGDSFPVEPNAVRFAFSAFQKDPHTGKMEKLPKSRIPASDQLEQYIGSTLSAICHHTGSGNSTNPSNTIDWSPNHNTYERVLLPSGCTMGEFLAAAEQVLVGQEAKLIETGPQTVRGAA